MTCSQIWTQQMIDECFKSQDQETQINSNQVIQVFYRTRFSLKDLEKDPPSHPDEYYELTLGNGTKIALSLDVFLLGLGENKTKEDLIEWIEESSLKGIEIEITSMTRQRFLPTRLYNYKAQTKIVRPSTILCVTQTHQINTILGLDSPQLTEKLESSPLTPLLDENEKKLILSMDTVGRFLGFSRVQRLDEKVVIQLNDQDVFNDWKTNGLFTMIYLLIPPVSHGYKPLEATIDPEILDCEVCFRLIRS